jgi:uncharacterized protein YdaU (DUF1376 family)
MSLAPSMPMFWDAYLADTTHLSTEEHGAYLLLLAAMWRRNGWVPDDDRDNGRILGLSPARWRRVKERLRPLLIFKDGQITQKNLLKIWETTQEKIAKNRENGAKGGRAKGKENNGIAEANGSVSDSPKASIPEPEPEPYTEEAKASSVGARKRGTRLPADWEIPEEWLEWACDLGGGSSMWVSEAAKFRDYWTAKAGRDATKLDWFATWRNWCRNASTGPRGSRPANITQFPRIRAKLPEGWT